ncbi:uncharacterized protein N7518_003065 [Penicillium psychrosexuale]|uniref:uncharacterized protein n=1 Tax=Penicillium psychrosexuale TaxID=1002107 RepID=UPI0025453C9B|nr:uncharacterized protein N7518_003065 [Penicillium psychrosexuale]KAJ5800997.1 hypothetical protein N7518_003065 [Penicillium psychrosexuale]
MKRKSARYPTFQFHYGVDDCPGQNPRKTNHLVQCDVGISTMLQMRLSHGGQLRVPGSSSLRLDAISGIDSDDKIVLALCCHRPLPECDSYPSP